MSRTGARSTSIPSRPQVAGRRDCPRDRALAVRAVGADLGRREVGRPVRQPPAPRRPPGRPRSGAAGSRPRPQPPAARDRLRELGPCCRCCAPNRITPPTWPARIRASRPAPGVAPVMPVMIDWPASRAGETLGAGRAGRAAEGGDERRGGERPVEPHTVTRTSPATSTRAISRLSSRITTSAGRPDVEPAELRQAEHAGRHRRWPRRPRRRAARRARAGSGPPRSSSARCRRARRRGRERLPPCTWMSSDAERVRAVARAGGGDRVGDERDPARRRAPGDARTVSEARWTPSRISWTITSSRASAAPTMPGSRCRNGRIALKRWVTVRDAEVERRVRLLGGGVAVAERDGDAALEQARDQRVGAGKLRRERHQPDRPAVEQPVEQRQVGIAPRRGVVRAEPARARGTGLRGGRRGCADSPPSVGTSASAASSLLLGRGDQGRQVGGDARLEQRLAGAAVAVGVGVEEVDAAEAVHLQVDEARHREAAARPASARPQRTIRPSSTSTSPLDERARRRAPPRLRASTADPAAWPAESMTNSAAIWSIPLLAIPCRSAARSIPSPDRRWPASTSTTCARPSAASSPSTTSRSRSPTASSSSSSALPGCGKSTLLRMIAGLEETTDGRISIGERDVTDLPPKDRDIAMVFQTYALYPHMSVRQNLGYGLKAAAHAEARDRAPRRRGRRAARALRPARPAARRSSRAASASGSRWAARSSREPQAFLLDEPLSNLDAKLRVGMRASLAQLHRPARRSRPSTSRTTRSRR